MLRHANLPKVNGLAVLQGLWHAQQRRQLCIFGLNKRIRCIVRV